jgi:predicted HTH transcriptional regulator
MGVKIIMEQNLDRVSESDIQDLVKNGVQEGKKIEYKQELTINTDSEKKEFLSDFSSFANTVGGYLIYGMKENNGMPIELVGLKINDPDH